jgi:hypothetical protein
MNPYHVFSYTHPQIATICVVIMTKTERKCKLGIVVFLTCSSNYQESNSTLNGETSGGLYILCLQTAGYK